jgi:cytosine/adenosine deaminase-related metal-dependent hydrolase
VKENLLEAAIGAHAAFTLGDEALSLLSEAISATGSGIHIHAAEDKYDSAAAHHLYQMDIRQRLEVRNLLNAKTICAHGVYLTDSDIEKLNDVAADAWYTAPPTASWCKKRRGISP